MARSFTILVKNKKKISLGELKFNPSGDKLAYVSPRKSHKVRLRDGQPPPKTAREGIDDVFLSSIIMC